MAFRPGFGMAFPHFPPPPHIMFGQLRMPGQTAPANSQSNGSKSNEPTTVFVGNISEKCTEEFIQKMLEECGKVASWKRIQGTNGKLQGFGFCNFNEPEGTLRALRILNDFHLGDKRLVVKAEDKVRSELRRWAIDHRKQQGKRDLKLKENELPADEEDLKRDEEIRLKILNWIESDHPELVTIAEDGEISEKEGRKDKKNDKDRGRSGRKDDRDRDRRRRSRSVDAKKKSSRRSRTPSSPRNKRARRSRSSSSSDDSSDSSRSRSSDSSRSSRSRSSRQDARKQKRNHRRDRSGTRTSEDSDDARERRAMRQQVKEKEQAYLARLKRWEQREKQKAKQYERDERKEKDRKKETQKEAKRLKHFLEDYDDEKDDPKYYKSSSLFQRKRDFEREREADQKDRLREQQEIEELKKEILAENEGQSDKEEIDIEAEARKRHQLKEQEALRRLRGDSGSPNPHQPLGHAGVGGEEEDESSSSNESGSEHEEGTDAEDGKHDEAKSETVSAQNAVPQPPVPPQPQTSAAGWKAIGENVSSSVSHNNNSNRTPLGLTNSPRIGSNAVQQQPIAQRLTGVFGNDDDDDEMTKRKKLKPFEITREERMQVMSAEEKKELTRSIIKKIPTGKDELFAQKIEWDYIDGHVMETRVKPWVTKKIAEFIGEEEKSLVDFICDKIAARASPEQILKDIAMIIDEDADMFVVKMWRLLVFEGQARKIGIS